MSKRLKSEEEVVLDDGRRIRVRVRDRNGPIDRQKPSNSLADKFKANNRYVLEVLGFNMRKWFDKKANIDDANITAPIPPHSEFAPGTSSDPASNCVRDIQEATEHFIRTARNISTAVHDQRT